MTDSAFVQRLDTLRSALASKRALGYTWREIARSYPPVAPGTLCAIFNGRKPRSMATRRALGLITPHRPKLNRRKLAVSLLGILHGGH